MVPDRHIVLIGLPGAGKTSTGRHLARVLQRPFADADAQLELTVGCTIPRLVRERGDDELHRRERQTLTELVGRFGPLVISAPGAVELGQAERALLARAAVVLWIRGPIDLLARLGDPAHRPRLAGGHHQALARLEGELSAVYDDVADHIVDIAPFHAAGGEPRQALARHIAALLGADDVAAPDDPDGLDGLVAPDGDPAALYEAVADHIVDVTPFQAADEEPDRAVTRHILTLLARHHGGPPAGGS